MALYNESAELRRLGLAIIEERYPHLSPVRIAWMFRDEAEYKRGKIEPGHTYRESNRQWAVHAFDFTIVIARDIWEKATPDFRYALLDHQIAFIGLDRKPDPEAAEGEERLIPETDPASGRLATFVRRPDVQEFEEVMVRHGAYYAELRSFLAAFAERRQRLREQERKGKGEEPAPTAPGLGSETAGLLESGLEAR